MDSHRSVIIFCFFLIFSTYGLKRSTEDGSGAEYSAIKKFTTGAGSDETNLKTNGFVELSLTPFSAVKVGTVSPVSNYQDAPAMKMDFNGCNSTNFESVFTAARTKGASITYLLWTPSEDLEVNLELSKYGLNQKYSPRMQILAFPNDGFITGDPDSPITPKDNDMVKSSAYCMINLVDVCTNSTMPISYTFHEGLSYIFQIYSGFPTTTVGNFFLRMNLANTVWIEDFDSTVVGHLPLGWYGSINATTAPTRNANSTWVVGDIDYLSNRLVINGRNNGIYSAIHMIPVGGVTEVQNFLGFNPTMPCFSGNIPCPERGTNDAHRIENVTTGLISLPGISNAEFQFTATLDNQYRIGTQDKPDWVVKVLYSYDGVEWFYLLGDNFPKVLTGPNAETWYTYQTNADVLAGQSFFLRLMIDVNSETGSRYFGIDKMRFVNLPNNHKMCSVDFTCGSPTCPIGTTNDQGNYGCGYKTNDGVCFGNTNECTSSTCVGKIAGADQTTGCKTVSTDSLCKGNQTSLPACETAVCSATLGCVYTQHDNLCASGASPCQDYYCDAGHTGCVYNSTIAAGSTYKHVDPAATCDDSASCTTDVCRPKSYVKAMDGSDGFDSSTGCTHTVIANYCDNNPQASTDYGNSTCVVSVCNPTALKTATDNVGPAGTGCYVKKKTELCSASSECDTKVCDYTAGCIYTPHDDVCQDKASTCVTAKCVSQVGCNYDDVTSKLVSVCGDGYSCTEETCENLNDKTKKGCKSTPKNDRCSTGSAGSTFGNSQCVFSECNPSKSGAGNAFDDSTLKSGCFSEPRDVNCDDYNRDCESHTCDFTAGCQYVTSDSACQAKVPACVNAKCPAGKTHTCDFSDVTTNLNTTCTDRSDCQPATCDNTTSKTDAAFGCRYTSDDSICQARTTQCVTAVCNGKLGCDYTDVTTKVNNQFCTDNFDCTADTCSSAGAAGTKGCVNTPVDSVCKTGLATCAQDQTTCSPSTSNTGSKGCHIVEDNTKCTGDVDCSQGTCNNQTGCSYQPSDSFCSTKYGLTCNTYKCILRDYNPANSYSDWSAKNADGCLVQQNCDDTFSCTIDTCDGPAPGACHHTADNTRCKQAKGCTQNICDPSSANHETDGCVYEVRCDDGIACTIDECVNTTAGRDKCLHTVDMTLCDDKVDCTYELLCDVNALVFDGAIPSTTKKYDNITGCIRIPMNEWCDDLNPCTIDVCEPTNSTRSGGCQHYAVDCDDGIPCTSDSCDALTGQCVHEEIVDYCNDDVTCTVDSCNLELGMCINVADDTQCSSFLAGDKCMDAYCRPGLDTDSSGCLFLETERCNDGIACTIDTCNAATGVCKNEADDTLCDDGGQCTDDKCDVELGKCTNIPNSDNCDDQKPCTVDFCDCETASCVHTAVDCSDEIACTVDSCDNDAGTCTNTPDNGLCDDGVLCTKDYCDIHLGRCVNKADDSFCQDPSLNADQSKLWLCQPPLVLTTYSTPHISGCVATERNCDDGIKCTKDYADADGNCVNEPINSNCNDGSECNDFTCSATLGCIAKPDDLKCDDGKACTVDVCGCDGKCEHNKIYCNDEIACTDDICDESLGGVCRYVPNNASCDDSIDCTFDTCDGIRGCSNIPHDDFCTFQESECSFGKCVIGAGGCEYEFHDELCDDRIQCTHDYCNGVHGCVHEVQDGLCDDGIACTSDVCTTDGCVYTPHDNWCDDNITCTDNFCGSEGCFYVAEASKCDDNLACTIDTCDAVSGCVHIADNSVCSDGISCTLDICNTTAQMCTHTAMNSYCSDDFNCTQEYCDDHATVGTTGCVVDATNCSWSQLKVLYLETQSAVAQIREKRPVNDKDGGALMEFLTKSDVDGQMIPRLVLTPTDQAIFGGDFETTQLHADDGVVIKSPLRLVPITQDSLGECNEIRRGTIRMVEISTPCGTAASPRTCNKDTLVVCRLGDTYEWTSFSPDA